MATFPKAKRLLDRREFERVQNGSSTLRAGSRHFLVLIAPREAAGPARLGVVASRRVGSAVRRNRAKRLVREFFRQLDLQEPIDMVVVVKTGAEKLSAAQAATELATALTRVRKGSS